MKRDMEPFWEKVYRDEKDDTFGPPSEEIRNLAARLSPTLPVLDAGCGEGRNALFLAEHGFSVLAFDISEAGIRKLRRRAAARNVSVEAWTSDIADFEFHRDFGLVMTHGLLHLIEADVCDRFLRAARTHTLPGGTHVHVVFTDAIPPPPDLAPFVRRPFHEGELRELYADWHVEQFSTYVKEDRHPGGLQHRHPINKLVARKP